MLFNSYVFILAFLPLTLVLYYFIRRVAGSEASFAWLALASFVFYGYWNPAYLLLLAGSVTFNYLVGILMQRSQANRKAIFIVGITANLALLGYYKYAGFFLGNFEALLGRDLGSLSIVLPLAISFFTFQQIAYLVDVYKGYAKEYRFIHYCLFIVFFPQLIAGPIVHHKEVVPQFISERANRFDVELFRAGIFQFIIGLTKKVLIADSVAIYATPIFTAADSGFPLSATEAWIGLLAYTFQIYFDFSGYSDMALGLGKMFGIRLPDNFNSPYKARSISDFWRRWHMTLSRFLRDYLYVPLGGNRKGKTRRYINLSLTMLLGGLWHGASWNFVIWGGLHGLYLIVNHAWSNIAGMLGLQGLRGTRAFGLLAWMITFTAAVLAWVPFRAETLDGAMIMYSAMFHPDGLAWEQLTGAGSEYIGNLTRAFIMLAVCFMIAIGLPNAQEWEAKLNAVMASFRMPGVAKDGIRIGISASLAGALIMCLSSMNKVSEFLYYQF